MNVADRKLRNSGSDAATSPDDLLSPVDDRDNILHIVAAQKVTATTAKERFDFGRQKERRRHHSYFQVNIDADDYRILNGVCVLPIGETENFFIGGHDVNDYILKGPTAHRAFAIDTLREAPLS